MCQPYITNPPDKHMELIPRTIENIPETEGFLIS